MVLAMEGFFFKAFHARAVVDTRLVLLSYQMTGYLSMI